MEGKREKTRSSLLTWRDVAVAALAALVPCVIVPLQTWLGNTTALGFGFMPLTKELALLWLAGAAVLWLFLAVGRRWLGALPVALVLAGMVYVYLETGFLTIGAPPLDGGLDFWYSRPRTLIDTGVLLAVFAGAIALRKDLVRYAVLVAVAVAVLATASLFDVKGENVKTVDNLGDDDNPFSKGIVPRGEVVRSAFFSTNRNVIVFILDSTTTEVFCDVLENEADIARPYRGFCAYRDVVGRYATTPFGVASMFTGRPYDGSQGVGEYVASPLSEESPLYQYLRANVPMFVQLGSFKKFGFVNRGGDAETQAAEPREAPPVTGSVLSHRIEGEQGWNLSELIRFRLAPFAVKRFVMKSFMVGWRKRYKRGDEFSTQFEEWLFPRLGKAPVNGDADLTLHVYHTRGTHDPYTLDKNGHPIPPVRGYKGSFGYTCFVMRQLGRLLNAMRKSGIYDKSLIIITADHGNSYSGQKTKHGVNMARTAIFNRAFPCFAVKVPGAKGPVRYSTTPVLHGNFARLLAEARLSDLTANRVDELLSSAGERIFTDMTKMRTDGAWEDYVVLPDGSVTNRLSKPTRDVASLPPIRLGKTYSFRFLKNSLSDSYPPVACDGLSDARVWGAGFVSGKVGMTLRVPDPGARYDVTLGMNILQPPNSDEDVLFMGEKRFFLRDAARGTVKKLVGKTGDSATITLTDLASGADGLLTLTAEKASMDAQVFFVSICVDQKE